MLVSIDLSQLEHLSTESDGRQIYKLKLEQGFNPANINVFTVEGDTVNDFYANGTKKALGLAINNRGTIEVRKY